MRTENTIKNAITAVFMQISVILFGFITQKVLLNNLGLEYTGLNGLFSNIISMLAIAELGIGSAITYHLYKPIATENYTEIKVLMKFYRNCYRVIAVAITFLGLFLIPFLDRIVGETHIQESTIVIYVLFLLDTVLSYLLSYKRTIIIANQKKYYINIVHMLTYSFFTILQIVFVMVFKNFYGYLLIKLALRLVENLIISHLANKQYPFLKEKETGKLPNEVIKDIIKKVKALFIHKIAAFLVTGTDNIIISYFLGITIVGYYSNYAMIINAITILVGQVFAGLTSSIGNLLIEGNKNKIYAVFKKIHFLNFVIATIASVGITILINNVVTICFGEQYILSKNVIITLAITFYFNITRQCMGQFKEAAGIFYEDRFIPLIESAVNIIFSIILLKFFGLAGVFMGTTISSLVLHLYSYPKFVYKKVLNRNYKEYFKMFFGFTILFIIITILSLCINNFIVNDNIIIDSLLKICIIFVIPGIIIVMLFRKTEEYIYYKNIIIKKFSRKRRTD